MRLSASMIMTWMTCTLTNEVSAFVPHHAVPTTNPSDLRHPSSSFSSSLPLFGPSINDPFPNLKGETQFPEFFDLYKYLGNDSWGIIFMHPGDFTPVCTTELGAAAEMEDEFTKRNCKLVGFSCNDAASHIEWIRDIEVATGSTVTFPLYCDPWREAAAELDILDTSNMQNVDFGIIDETMPFPEVGLPLTVRSVYILKPDKSIALVLTYPASTGRNMHEIVRALDSVQLTEQSMVATPADWKRGEDVIVNYPLSNKQAEDIFGKGGFRVVDLPSEAAKANDDGKPLERNYLRYTKDPTGSSRVRRKVKQLMNRFRKET